MRHQAATDRLAIMRVDTDERPARVPVLGAVRRDWRSLAVLVNSCDTGDAASEAHRRFVGAGFDLQPPSGAQLLEHRLSPNASLT
ncbi:hypothetical protein WI25_11280 [Burkholderia cepacia]|nr:hypothetical protein WI25_11280 [Burkholderia cepacia]